MLFPVLPTATKEQLTLNVLCIAASTPSLFGAPAPSTGALSIFSGPAFGGQSQPAFGSTLFGGANQPQQQPGLFGIQPQQQPQQQQQGPQLQSSSAALTTKDGKPLSHATKWEDISPQGQAYLLELECALAFHVVRVVPTKCCAIQLLG